MKLEAGISRGEAEARGMVLDERQLDEIRFCLVYESKFKHGADGHNRMILLAKLAQALGFSLPNANGPLYFNDEQRDVFLSLPAGKYVRLQLDPAPSEGGEQT